MENENKNSRPEAPKSRPILKLVGHDGNAFAILSRAYKQWIAAGNTKESWDVIQKEAMSGDYDNLLRTMIKYFDVK